MQLSACPKTTAYRTLTGGIWRAALGESSKSDIRSGWQVSREGQLRESREGKCGVARALVRSVCVNAPSTALHSISTVTCRVFLADTKGVSCAMFLVSN